MKFKPAGIIPAMITPLTKDEKINESSTRKLVNHLIDGGVHGVFAVGTTGEFYGLSHDEKRQCFEIVKDETSGRVPIYAGTGAITTKEVIKLNRIAEDLKYDAVSILTPMFISPSPRELYNHYERIARETSLPIILYNNEPKTGVDISPDTVEQLAEIDNIIGIKDSSGDFTKTSEYIRRTRDKDFHVLAGRDTLIHATLCYGGSGSVAATGNIVPQLASDIYDKYIAGDIQGSLEAQFKLAPLRFAFTLGSFPTVIKEGLALIGIDVGPCLSPVSPMSTEEKEILKKLLEDIGVLKRNN